MIILFLCAISLLQAQNDCPAAGNRMYKEAQKARKDSLYDKAINKATSARNCDPNLASQADALILEIFEDIDMQKRTAVKQRDKANTLLNYFLDSTENVGWVYDYYSNAFFIVDRDGKQVSSPKYYEPQPFKNGIGIAKNNSQMYLFVNNKGKESEHTYQFLHEATSNILGNTLYYYGKNQYARGGETYSLIDIRGNLIGDCESDILQRDKNDTIIQVHEEHKVGFFHKNGHWLMPKTTLSLGNTNEKMAIVKIDKWWGLENKNGHNILASIYGRIDPFMSDLVIVTDSNYLYKGVASEAGLITPLIYNSIKPFSDDLFVVEENNHFELINKKGEKLRDINSYKTYVMTNGLIRIENADGKEGLMDKMGNILLQPYYDIIWDFSEGLAVVLINSKMGVIDEKGSLCIDTIYEEIFSFSEDLAAAKLNGKTGFINKKGCWVIPNIYNETNSFHHGVARIRKDSVYKYGLINKQTNKIAPLIGETHQKL